MARVPCRKCKKLINVGTRKCPYCGMDVGVPLGGLSKIGILGALVAIFIVVVASENDAPTAPANASTDRIAQDESKWHAVPAGSKISNSPWDGSVYEVERYLERTLKDPGSYEGIEWSPVVTKLIEGSRRYAVRHKYRAKNSFGGYVVDQVYFVMDANGTVLSAVKM